MKIQVSYGYTQNLGNYESQRADAHIERDLEPGETPEQAMGAEFVRCRDFVEIRLGLRKPMQEPEETGGKVQIPTRRRV